MLVSNCLVCDSKKLKFIKERKASWLLRILVIKITLIEIPLVGLLLFKSIKQVNTRYKMNETEKKAFISSR